MASPLQLHPCPCPFSLRRCLLKGQWFSNALEVMSKGMYLVHCPILILPLHRCSCVDPRGKWPPMHGWWRRGENKIWGTVLTRQIHRLLPFFYFAIYLVKNLVTEWFGAQSQGIPGELVVYCPVPFTWWLSGISPSHWWHEGADIYSWGPLSKNTMWVHFCHEWSFTNMQVSLMDCNPPVTLNHWMINAPSVGYS